MLQETSDAAERDESGTRSAVDKPSGPNGRGDTAQVWHGSRCWWCAFIVSWLSVVSLLSLCVVGGAHSTGGLVALMDSIRSISACRHLVKVSGVAVEPPHRRRAGAKLSRTAAAQHTMVGAAVAGQHRWVHYGKVVRGYECDTGVATVCW